jgi:hypothetical protein
VKLGKCFTSDRDEDPHVGAFHLVRYFPQASRAFLDAAKEMEILLDEISKMNWGMVNANEENPERRLQQAPANNRGQSLSEGVSRVQLEDSDTK